MILSVKLQLIKIIQGIRSLLKHMKSNLQYKINDLHLQSRAAISGITNQTDTILLKKISSRQRRK